MSYRIAKVQNKEYDKSKNNHNNKKYAQNNIYTFIYLFIKIGKFRTIVNKTQILF